MNQPNYPNLLTEEKAATIKRLLEGLENIAHAINRWNDLNASIGYHTKLITIRHVGAEGRLFFGETSAALDLQRVLLLHQIDKIDMLQPSRQEKVAA
jgi:hypothetical protein